MKVKDQNLFDQTLVSYEKNINDEDLSPVDFMLYGHELNEFHQIPNDKIPRYIAYSY